MIIANNPWTAASRMHTCLVLCSWRPAYVDLSNGDAILIRLHQPAAEIVIVALHESKKRK